MSKISKKKASSSRPKHYALLRMYNVGFGDAFLLFLHRGEQKSAVLVDCGTIDAAEFEMSRVVDQILDDVEKLKGERSIDIVIGTHRHKDHISGFSSSTWNDVPVEEVWLPWTEDPKDPVARKLSATQVQLAAQLHRRAAELKAQSAPWAALVGNALANAKAMTTLRQGFAGNPARRYLPLKGTREREFTTEALPGVTIHVLGPSRDVKHIKRMNPPSGESYLQMAASRAGGKHDRPPFADALTPEAFKTAYPNSGLEADDEDKLRAALAPLEPGVAAALDHAINGTSLMLVLEVGGKFFLLPGDAQWGTWERALADPEWRELLGRTHVYKVGHHGSHNATPVDFVENVIPDDGSKLVALASTKKRSQWPKVPKKELLEALRTKNIGVLRSDDVSLAENVAKVKVEDEGIWQEIRVDLDDES